MIALATLVLGLAVVGTRDWPGRRFAPVLVFATVSGGGYPIDSEWLNTGLRMAWSDSPWIPVLPSLGTGLAPSAQWFVLPPLGLLLCRRRYVGQR